MKHINASILALLVATTLTGCAGGIGGADYGRSQVRGEQSVRLATVMSVRQVRIEGTNSGLGTLAGAAAGGIAGNSAGRGNGNALATVAGVVVGGLAGSALENGASKQEGVEITVQYDNGRLSAITQGADEAFHVGDRVMVTSGSGVTRVSKVAPGSALLVTPPPAGSAPGYGGASGSGAPVPPAGSAPAHPPAHASGEGTGAGAAPPSRWYCPDKGYYPDVPTCTSKWLKVAE